jgi:uncharacterized membrane protein YgcG
VDGDKTNTDKIQSHDQGLGRGFNPAAALEAGVSRRVEDLVGPDPAKTSWGARLLTTALVLTGLALVVASSDPEVMTLVAYIAGGMAMLIAFGAASGLAAQWRRRIHWPPWVIVFFVLPAAVVLAVPAAFVLRRDLGVSDVAAAGVGLMALILFASVLGAARSRHSRRGLDLRRRMVAARGYFIEQLRQPRPALDDACFPYLVAFGLDDQVQKWFRAHPPVPRPGPSSPSDSSYSTSSSSSPSSSSGRTWTGGGGSFGGAGASSTWVAALGGVTAGVAAPASGRGQRRQQQERRGRRRRRKQLRWRRRPRMVSADRRRHQPYCSQLGLPSQTAAM